MYPAVLLMYFISAAVILLASLALTVQVSLPYNNNGRASVLYNFILVFFRVFCGLKTLFKIPVIFQHSVCSTQMCKTFIALIIPILVKFYKSAGHI